MEYVISGTVLFAAISIAVGAAVQVRDGDGLRRWFHLPRREKPNRD